MKGRLPVGHLNTRDSEGPHISPSIISGDHGNGELREEKRVKWKKEEKKKELPRF